MNQLISNNKNKLHNKHDDSIKERESCRRNIGIEQEVVVLSEEDFYPPPDERYYNSGIRDVCGGDTFDDYLDYFYEEYYDDLYDE